MGYWEEDHRGSCSSHHIISRVHTANMIYDWCSWSSGWDSVCEVSPLQSYSIFHPFCTLWKDVTKATPKEGGVCLSFLRTSIYLHILFGILLHGKFVSLPYLTYSIIYLYLISMDSWIFLHTLAYNPLLLYFVVQTVAVLATGALSSWLLCFLLACMFIELFAVENTDLCDLTGTSAWWTWRDIIIVPLLRDRETEAQEQ